MIRDNIIKYFKSRECYTLPRPIDSEEDLKRLKEVPFDNLKPNFKLEFMGLKEKIYKGTEPKAINGKRITGPVLANLLEEFVNSINKGGVPNINNAWDNVISKDIEDLKIKALRNYKASVKELQEIMDQEDLVRNLLDLKKEAFFTFDKFLVLNRDSLMNKQYSKWYIENKDALEDDIRVIESKLLKENNEKAHKHNYLVLKREYKDITEYMFKTTYSPESIERLIESIKKYNNNLIFSFFYGYLNSSIGNEKLNMFINYYNENIKEILYYLATSSSMAFRQNNTSTEIQTKENLVISQELELAAEKLKEINGILETKVTPKLTN
jgi:hypothetical protein